MLRFASVKPRVRLFTPYSVVTDILKTPAKADAINYFACFSHRKCNWSSDTQYKHYAYDVLVMFKLWRPSLSLRVGKLREQSSLAYRNVINITTSHASIRTLTNLVQPLLDYGDSRGIQQVKRHTWIALSDLRKEKEEITLQRKKFYCAIRIMKGKILRATSIYKWNRKRKHIHITYGQIPFLNK